MVKTKIGLALIGLGKIARDQHLPAIEADERFNLLATVSPDGASCGAPGFASLEQLLASRLEIEAVAICTPPAARAGLALRALDAGLHVLLEKPPGASMVEMRRLSDAIEQTPATVMTAWHSRENAAVDAARKWLGRQRVVGGSIIWKEDIRVWHPGQDWLLEANGFGVFDPAINAFSILTSLFPEAVLVEDAELSIPVNRAAAVAAGARLRLGSAEGPCIDCEFSILHEGEQQWDIAIETDQGQLLLANGGTRLAVNGQAVVAEPDQEYRRLYDRFASLIMSGNSSFDCTPLAIVEAIGQRGSRVETAAFYF
jgi:predicted dehydrogenase